MKPARTKFWPINATQSAWLLGVIALCANLACSSSDTDGGSSGAGGAAPAAGGSSSHGGAAVAGSSTVVGGGGSGAAGSPSTGGAGSAGSAGSSSVAGSGGSAGQVSAGGAGSGGASSGGGTSMGGGTSGGSTGFDPCPATGDCKVLPLGDSITFGTPTNNGGYRVELFTKAVGDNLHLTFVGSQSDGPAMVAGKPFPKGNEGYPGIKTAALNTTHVQKDALKDMPGIILLHIGTNNVSEASAPAELEKIIDEIVMRAPNSLLAVASIIPLGTSTAVPTYNAGIPALVQKKAAAGKHVIFVDQYKDFPTGELTDGVHPTDAKGYPRMGDKWYAAIKPYLH